jgi:hypothetical protein
MQAHFPHELDEQKEIEMKRTLQMAAVHFPRDGFIGNGCACRHGLHRRDVTAVKSGAPSSPRFSLPVMASVSPLRHSPSLTDSVVAV